MLPGKGGERCENGCYQEIQDDANRMSLGQQLGNRLQDYLKSNDVLHEDVRSILQQLADNLYQPDNSPLSLNHSPNQLSGRMKEILQVFQADSCQVRSFFDGAVRRGRVSIAPVLSQEALTEVLALFEAIYMTHYMSPGRVQTALQMGILQLLTSPGFSTEAIARNSLRLQSLLLFWLINEVKADSVSQRQLQAVLGKILQEMSEVSFNRRHLSCLVEVPLQRNEYDLSEPNLADRFLRDRGDSACHAFSLAPVGCAGLTVSVYPDRVWVLLFRSLTQVSVNVNDLHWVIGHLQHSFSSTTIMGTLYNTMANMLHSVGRLLRSDRSGNAMIPGMAQAGIITLKSKSQ